MIKRELFKSDLGFLWQLTRNRYLMEYLMLAIIVLYMPLTILVAKMGEKRKIGYQDSAIIGIIASPIIAFLVVLASPKLTA